MSERNNIGVVKIAFAKVFSQYFHGSYAVTVPNVSQIQDFAKPFGVPVLVLQIKNQNPSLLEFPVKLHTLLYKLWLLRPP